MSSQQPQQQQPTLHRGIVKQVLSGDSVVIRGQPKGGPPPEQHLGLANITARKLARRTNPNVGGSVETKDEPYAWEAREFLRKKLVGKEVAFTVEYKVPGSPTGRGYGCIYLGKDASGENITELLVSEGLVEVRRGGIKPSDEQQKLCDLEDLAKSASKGIWSKDNPQDHVRDIKWMVENPRNFVDSLHGEPLKAVVEHVRDGSTIRAFLLPNFQHVTLMMSGIRCPSFKQGEEGNTPQAEPFAEEAKFFTESRLLHRDIEIILESVANANYIGSIIHPNGSIAELLVKEGFARCVDWSMAFVSSGVEKLRAAERFAKEKRVRIWKDYSPSTTHVEGKGKEYSAKVMEIVNADALVVKTNDGALKKIFLASIRPPRISEGSKEDAPKDTKGRQFRPLYDIPYLYEAREFLRQNLIGKKVNVVLDYVQPASNSFPEKTCCTVTIGGINVAEALVSKGYATVVRYRQDDDQRSSHYDELLAAETKAAKSGKGMHGKKDTPIHRVADVSGDYAKAKQFLPFLQRAGRSEGVVEYVSSGSRLRLYVPKETCLITFLLAGISCPRASRIVPNMGALDSEPFGDEALAFTKELCMQRAVEVEVENMDKAGNFIGWLWVDNTNLSVALVEEGLASVHSTAERSSHFRALQTAEENAKQRKGKIWANYEEPKEQDIKDDIVERSISYVSVVLTDIRPTLQFYAQHVEEGPQLEELMEQLRQEFTTNPPLPGSYMPKRGDLCAAKFVDGEWYRARVEKLGDGSAHVFYADYGNREVTKNLNLAALPLSFQGLRPAAHEYGLACAALHPDVEYQQDAMQAFATETENLTLLLNVEYKAGGIDYVTLLNSDTKEDIIKGLISEGFLLAEMRKEKRLKKLVTEYKNAQEAAKKKRLNMWRYGDFTEDDAKEFGYKR